MAKTLLLFLILIIYLNACSLFKKSYDVPETLLDPDMSWAETTLGQMNIDQKIGQLFMMQLSQPIYSDTDPDYVRLKNRVRRYFIGGIIIFGGDAYQRSFFINDLQKGARIPLLFAADFEDGAGQQIKGATRFISSMGIAATGDMQNAFDVGRITATEARAMGFHITFSPVVDVNNNPDNPIINTRAFSDDPGLVSQFAAAYIRGVQQHGLLATAKHYPGHGNTIIDSHKDLPELSTSFRDLEKTELVPFMSLFKSDLAAVMTAHIALPNYDTGYIRPATLSPLILNDLLRKKLRFNGLVISDAFDMDAIKDYYYEGDAAVKAIQSGVDIILMPINIQSAFFAIREAIQDRRISIQRINESVKRILYSKSVLGLHKQPLIDQERLIHKLRTPISLHTAQKIAREAITLVKNEHLPLSYRPESRFHSIAFTGELSGADVQNNLVKTLKKMYPHVLSEQVDPKPPASFVDSILVRVASADYIIASYHYGLGENPDSLQSDLINALINLGKPVINLFFGSPYLSMQYPQARNLLFAYSDNTECQIAAAEALSGEISISGKLPVTLPGVAERGSGEELPQGTMTLTNADYRSAAPNPVYLDSLTTYLNSAITDSAFPGCAISVGYRGKLIFDQGFGHFTYDPRSKKVSTDAIYDLASLTKVVATTTIAMILYDRDLLQLDWKVADIIPDFKGKDKDQVTIRHLLTHTSGLPGWVQFYLTLSGKERIVQKICATDLIYQPGTQTVYSDLGMILMQRIIETIAQKPLDLLVKEYLSKPLGLERTFYTPAQTVFGEVVPTELSEFHKQVVRGFVHDENTFAMGGVSGHAGLFSTVEDLAVFCQMYLNGGIYDYQRILNAETIDLFTVRQNLVEGSTRCLGWDSRSDSGSMSGDYMSMRVFGHSGFTGTTIWIDPENQVFVVLLTNRVYPTRNNQKIRQVRPRVHNLVMKAVLAGE